MDAADFPWQPLGELLVDRGVLTETQLEVALAEQHRTGRLLGQILVGAGCVTAVSLTLALAEQHGVELRRRRETDWSDPEAPPNAPEVTEPQSWRPLGKLLVDGGFVTQEELDQALAEQRHEPGRRLGEILVAGGCLTGADLACALAEQHGVAIGSNEELVDVETVLRPSAPGEPVYQVWDVGLKPAYALRAVVHEAANFLEAADYATEYILDREPNALEIRRSDGDETLWTYSKTRADATAAARRNLTDTFGFDPNRWGRGD